jgi:4-hydroxy-tetrahydrodipicolinate synthase
MRYQHFRGTGVALITPFKTDFSIDWASLERVIEHVVADGGVDYIVSLGTTGEAITLSSKECQQIFDFTVDKVRNRVPVVAGWFGANSTSHLIERLKNVDLRRAAAVLSSSPAYNKPTQEGIFQHYAAVVKESPVPIILYNVPGRTASNMAPETVCRIAALSDKFVGVKEASGNLVQAQYIIKHRPSNEFLVISGDDQITLGMIACGGDGVISVIANSHPVEFAGMVRAGLAGDLAKARFINDKLHDVHPLLYAEGNPVGIKAAVSILGLCENALRLPLVPMVGGNYEALKSEMAKAAAYVS